jgi:hemoglobin-like flavoprotein
MPEERTLSQRLEFMKLDASAREATKSLKPLIEKELPQALDSFYARVKQFPETSRFFRDDAHIQTAKSAQLKHWSKISAGEFSDEYAQSVRTIGQTHARIGLDARWYIGGYALITEQLIRAAIDNYWPKGAFGGKGNRRVGVVDRGKIPARDVVLFPRLDHDRALTDGGKKIVGIENGGRSMFQTEPPQPGQRQQGGVEIAGVEPAQPRLHIAAQHLDPQIGAQPLGHRLTPQ